MRRDKGREPPRKITTADQPLDLPVEAEKVLEHGRLFWLDPKNRGRRSFRRALVPGEELPFKIHAKSYVIVTRRSRTFIALGKPTLVIEEAASPPELKRGKRKHKSFDVAALQASLRESRLKKQGGAVPPPEPTIDGDLRRTAEHTRQMSRRLARERKRQAIRAQKAAA